MHVCDLKVLSKYFELHFRSPRTAHDVSREVEAADLLQDGSANVDHVTMMQKEKLYSDFFITCKLIRFIEHKLNFFILRQQFVES